MPKLSGRFSRFFILILVSGFFSGNLILAQNDTLRKSKGVGDLVNGRKEGTWKFFYPDGSLMAVETYREGSLNGKSVNYFPDGIISSIENWKEDLQEDSAWYFHRNGKIFRKGRYEQGVYQGEWLAWFPNGTLEQKGGYLDGLPHGPYLNWFENGFLKEEGFYFSGRKEGQFIFYFPDREGRVQTLANFKNDKPSGLWIYFTRRGKVDKTERMPIEN
jgi:antitoxin component YwqK of YwqJK toxin-antitoxin module